MGFGKPKEETNSVHERFKQKFSLTNNLNCLHFYSLLNTDLPLSFLTFGMVFCLCLPTPRAWCLALPVYMFLPAKSICKLKAMQGIACLSFHRTTEWLRLEGTSGGHLVNSPAQAWSPTAVAQGHVQMAFESLQGGRLHLSGQPLLVFTLTVKKHLLVFRESLLFQFVPIVSGPLTRHHWKEPGSVTFSPSLQICTCICMWSTLELLQAKQNHRKNSHSQPFLIGKISHSLDYLSDPSLEFL